MSMYTKILVAVDGSSGSRCALDEAVRFAHALHASLEAVCVVEHPARLVDVNAGFAEEPPRASAAAAAATHALDEARTLFATAQVDGTTRAIDAYGEDVAAVLYRVAAEEGADLVVMGTRGRWSGMKRLWPGSVASAFVRMADRPVLLVREPVHAG